MRALLIALLGAVLGVGAVYGWLYFAFCTGRSIVC